ncbi:MAG: translation initiation factor IF-2, partial [Dysgonamonadaceae bacterium]|nr:translation initiation factor IF-2 [Dysgonamonadaceae bacterium]
MSIRLIRVSKELNVGVSSLVEFLHKKGVQIEVNPNIKIDNEHYEMLVVEFGKDKKIKKTVEQKREEQLKRDKKETVAIEGYDIPDEKQKDSEVKATTTSTNLTDDIKPQFKIVGNIDLDTLNAKPKKRVKPEKKEESKETVRSDSKEKEIEETPQPDIEPEKDNVEKEVTPQLETEEKEKVKKDDIEIEKEVSEEIKAEDIEEVETKEQTATVQQEKSVEKIEEVEESEKELDEEEELEEEKENNLFRLNDSKLETNIVVKGTIDLSSINERTRPARKSRAQRKKERLEREGKAASAKRIKEEKIKALKKESIDEKKKSSDDSEESTKKKRKRIRKGKVNIEKTKGAAPARRRPTLKKPVKKEVSEEDVQKQIKETLARLTQKRTGGRSARHRRDKRDAVVQRQQDEIKQQEKESRTLQLTEFVTANDLANMMDVPVTDVISTCMSIGVMVAINQRLDAETIDIVADEFGFKTKYVSADVIEAITQEEDEEKDLIPRSPIVTVMGHVDHGKTSLLDSIRNTNVIAGEAGGITQHIGAYHVTLKSGKKITFLDTPGHEAFTAMRARGAKVTDVAIIIVAADDNVMPQTVEAINHASAAGVPIVFAINKIDKPGANPEKVKEELANMNYLVEDWGGKYQSQDISAKQGTGVAELLEKVQLEAELLELKANPDRNGFGSVIESSLDKGRGYVSTVLVQNGTLKVGDVVLAGAYFGRIKAMYNERNQNIEKACPAEPALILGLNGAPQAGDIFHVIESEQEARSIANKREQLQREQSIRTQKILTLDDIGRRIAIGNFQELNIIVKGDVDGS